MYKVSKMNENECLEKAIRIAVNGHFGQVDKSGNLYILHPLRVMQYVGENKLLQSAAVMHDLIEDTDWTIEDLVKEGFPNCVISAIDAMTRRTVSKSNNKVKEIYHTEFINRVKLNEFACIIKMMDLTDNSSTDRLIHLPIDMMQRFIKKYGKTKLALWENYLQASISVYGRVLQLNN